MELTIRLETVAAELGEGGCLIDVGTDHAYLPIALVERGKYKSAVASDVAPGPLALASENVRSSDVSGKIALCLSDGLESVPEPEGRFSVAVCGMGGDMIAAVLSRAPEWARRADVLVLQPMTKPERLRAALAGLGYMIVRERGAVEGARAYLIITAKYDGRERFPTDSDLLVGEEGTHAATADTAIYLEKLSATYRAVADARREAGVDSSALKNAAERAKKIANKIKESLV